MVRPPLMTVALDAAADAAAAHWAGQRALLGWDREGAGRSNGAGSGGDAIAQARGREVHGTTLQWTGPGDRREWQLPFAIVARRSGSGECWARLDGVPVVSARRSGGRRVVAVGLDPADARAEPEIGAVLRRVLIACEPAAACLDFSGTVALRMDDPGASASVHLDPWSFEKMGAEDWEGLGSALSRRNATMTVAYTPGWVDDGDPTRGDLVVAGMRVRRSPGAVHPSPLVRYTGRAAHSGDYEGEYRAVTALRDRGLCSVELHGYTHTHPETERWAAASSRHEKLGWYREFAAEHERGVATRAPEEHPVALGLELFRRHFGETPTTLVCPGNAHGPESLRRAHAAGLQAVAADRLAIRDNGAFSWLEIGAVALEHPARRALGAGLPAIACFHDRDLAISGIDWLREGLAGWRAAGATRFTDLRELVSALGLRLRMRAGSAGWELHAARAHGRPLPRPFPVRVSLPRPADGKLEAVTPAGVIRLEADQVDAETLAVELPAGI